MKSNQTSIHSKHINYLDAWDDITKTNYWMCLLTLFIMIIDFIKNANE